MPLKDTRSGFIRKGKERHRLRNGASRYCYERVSYRGSKTPVKIRCPLHGYFMIRPNDFLGSKNRKPKGCPVCAAPLGEREIWYILRDLGYDFTFQASFDDCRSPKGHKLRFDFYIPGALLFIEYNGRQHEEQIPHFQSLEKIKAHDQIKEKYARSIHCDLVWIDCHDPRPLYEIVNGLFASWLRPAQSPYV